MRFHFLSFERFEKNTICGCVLDFACILLKTIKWPSHYRFRCFTSMVQHFQIYWNNGPVCFSKGRQRRKSCEQYHQTLLLPSMWQAVLEMILSFLHVYKALENFLTVAHFSIRETKKPQSLYFMCSVVEDWRSTRQVLFGKEWKIWGADSWWSSMLLAGKVYCSWTSCHPCSWYLRWISNLLFLSQLHR